MRATGLDITTRMPGLKSTSHEMSLDWDPMSRIKLPRIFYTTKMVVFVFVVAVNREPLPSTFNSRFWFSLHLLSTLEVCKSILVVGTRGPIPHERSGSSFAPTNGTMKRQPAHSHTVITLSIKLPFHTAGDRDHKKTSARVPPGICDPTTVIDCY